MPAVTITLSDEEHALLMDEYKQMSIEWLRRNPASVPPQFEQWLAGMTVAGARERSRSTAEVDQLRTLNSIEKLVTGLKAHGFGLAHLGKPGNDPAESAASLAETLVADLGLSLTRAKRIEELLVYYAKSARDIADAAHVGVTNRAYGALHEAYRELLERTAKAALSHLGEEQALGRAEGGAAILVSVQAMNRRNATEKTEEFKANLRSLKK